MEEIKPQKRQTEKEEIALLLSELIVKIAQFPELVSTYQGTFLEELENSFKITIKTYRMRISFILNPNQNPEQALKAQWESSKQNPLFQWLDQEETQNWDKFINTLTPKQNDPI